MSIGIGGGRLQLNITTEWGKFEIHTLRRQVRIHSELPKVEIDQHECFETAGLKGNPGLVRDGAQRGYQQVLEYTAKKAQDGDMLAAIENGGNPIVEMAVRDSFSTHEFGIDYIPKARPKITVKGGTITVDASDIEQNPKGVIINYRPSKVSYNMQYVGRNIDIML